MTNVDCLSSWDNTKEKLVMQVLYGSETGTAQDIAEQIWKSAQRKQLPSTVSSLDEYDIRCLSSEQLIVFVVATTGQGDPPANMKIFWKRLLGKSLRTDLLQNLKYGVLGLGDSSYSKFNFAAKKLNKRLAQLGGKELLPIGLADDQHILGIDTVVDPWIKKLWEELADVFDISAEDKIPENLIIHKYNILIMGQIAPFNPVRRHEIAWNCEYYTFRRIEYRIINQTPNIGIYAKETNINLNIKIGTIFENRRTTSEDHFQDVRLITILLEEDIKYEPGDIIYIRPRNSTKQVEHFFDILAHHHIGLYPDTGIKVMKKELKVPVALNCSILSLKDIVEQYWDLNFKPRRSTMHTLSLISEHELEKEKLREFASPGGQEEFYDYINRPRRNILEVFTDFPHTISKLTIELLFEIMSPIKPRPYSIASSSKATPNMIQILVAVVKYRTRLLEPRLGLCSNWLASLKKDDKIIFKLQKGTLRFEHNKPMILIGPGTGIAPLRSFLLETEMQERDLKNCALFFGCRYRRKDYHCKEDFDRLSREKDLQVFCAFSRDQDHKIYVQHIIRKERELCWQFLQNGGSIYLAGNSKNMPNNVRDEFIDLIKEVGKMTEEQAEAFIKNLEENNRYQIETWG